MTSFYGSSCANNGKDALNTPETLCVVTLYSMHLYLEEWNPRVWDMSEVNNPIYPTSAYLRSKGALN
eukprot:1187825-Prorocentrum_minimum.AAC.2